MVIVLNFAGSSTSGLRPGQGHRVVSLDILSHSPSPPFSSPEATLPLVSTKNHGLWPNPIFLSTRRLIAPYSQAIRFVRLDEKSVNRGLPVLDQPRGRDSGC